MPASIASLQRKIAKNRISSGKVKKVKAMQPNYYAEDQQPVEVTLTASVKGRKWLVTLPPFRYHFMVVLRVMSVSRPVRPLVHCRNPPAWEEAPWKPSQNSVP